MVVGRGQAMSASLRAVFFASVCGDEWSSRGKMKSDGLDASMRASGLLLTS